MMAGFVLVTLAADWLVDGASGVAKRLNVSDLAIGLTVVAFGTSAPEFIVNIIAAVEGNSEIALTNIIGSNTINTLIVLGLSAVVFPLTAQKSTVRVDLPLSILASLLVLLMGMDFFLPDGFWGVRAADRGISQLEGIVLLLVFIFFMYHSIREGRREGNAGEAVQVRALWKSVALIIIGLVGLVLSGEVIVRCATAIARSLGVSDAIIGVTIVALGTSLPELATSVVAAFKKNVDLAIGNVVGSNLFNVFFILGTSSLIHPLPAYSHLVPDALVALVASVLVWIFVLGRRHRVSRWQGGLLLLVYAVYLWWMLTHLA